METESKKRAVLARFVLALPPVYSSKWLDFTFTMPEDATPVGVADCALLVGMDESAPKVDRSFCVVEVDRELPANKTLMHIDCFEFRGRIFALFEIEKEPEAGVPTTIADEVERYGKPEE